MKRIDQTKLFRFFICAWLLSQSTPFLVQAQEQKQETAFRPAVDWNRFRYSDSLTYFEYSISLPQKALTFIPDGDHFIGTFKVTAQFLQNDSLIVERTWNNQNRIDSLSQLADSQRLYSVGSFIVRPGAFQFSIQVQDLNNPQRSVKYSSSVQTVIYPRDKLSVSDIQFAAAIKPDTTKNPFVKNGYQILPNPEALYGIGLPMLYCYSEIYNFAPATTDSGGMFEVIYRIFDTDGKEVKSLPPVRRRKPGTSAVELKQIPVVTLLSGAYSAQMEVRDLETRDQVVIQKKFYVYREADYADGGTVFQKREQVNDPGSAGLDADRYDVMTEKELDEEFEYARYISSRDERNTYKKLKLEGKRNYLKEFWAKRDATPGTAANEFKNDYLNRVQLANSSYKGNFRDGWRTDRGRILLTYGRADEIERFPFGNENRAYEIWHFYSVQGGVHFIFVDRRSMGDYELVHSTARGEIYDPDWTRWINPTDTSGYNQSYYE